jgi:hypothetical protein
MKKALHLVQLKAAESPPPAGFRICKKYLMVRPAAQQSLPENLLLRWLHGRHDQLSKKHPPST